MPYQQTFDEITVTSMFDATTYWYITKQDPKLDEQLKRDIHDDSGPFHHEYRADVGEMVAVFDLELYRWLRGEVQSVNAMMTGHLASIFLVDYGITLHKVNCRSVKQLPTTDFCKNTPPMAKKFQLDLIVPLTLAGPYYEHTKIFEPVFCNQWDSSAFTFVSKMLNSASKCFYQATDRKITDLSGNFGDLVLLINDELLSVSDALVREGFANKRETLFHRLAKDREDAPYYMAGPIRADVRKWQIDVQKLLPAPAPAPALEPIVPIQNTSTKPLKSRSPTMMRGHTHGKPKSPTMRDQAFGNPKSPTMLDQAYGSPKSPTMLDQAYGSPKSPTMLDQEYGNPKSPTKLDQAYGNPKSPTMLDQAYGSPKSPTMQDQEYGSPKSLTMLDQGYYQPKSPTMQELGYYQPKSPTMLDQGHYESKSMTMLEHAKCTNDIRGLQQSPVCMLELFRQKHMAQIAEERRTIGEKSRSHMHSEMISGIQKIYFDSADHPDETYIRLVKYDAKLKELEQEIDRYARALDKKPRLSVVCGAWKPGMYCLCRFKEHWYRARVTKLHRDGDVSCFFVDHGDKSKVSPYRDVLEIEQYLLTRMLFQAIECRLAGIQRVGDEEEWRYQAADVIYDCSANIADYSRELFSKVCSFDADGKPAILMGFQVTGLNSVSLINRVLLELNLADAITDEVDWLNVSFLD